MGKVVTSEVFVSRDFNDHVGSDMVGFGEVYRCMFWDWSNKRISKGLHFMNIYTCFQKRKSQLITFKLGGEAEAMIDFTLVNNKCRKVVSRI